MTKELKHFGVLGMKWGHRKANERSSGGGRKTGLKGAIAAIKGEDQRKVDALFGARNRKKIRNFLLGDPDQFIKTFPGMNNKYQKLDKVKREKMRKTVSTTLATLSVISMATIVYELTR